MKNFYFITFIFQFVLSNLSGQSNIVGKYQNYFGSRIELRADGTFSYSFSFDLVHKWTMGSWSGTDTLVLNSKAIYDTVDVINRITGIHSDSLILSSDTISSSISREKLSPYASYGQDPWIDQKHFVIKKDRLYVLQSNGKLLTKKNRGFWTKRRFPPYYFKIQD